MKQEQLSSIFQLRLSHQNGYVNFAFSILLTVLALQVGEGEKMVRALFTVARCHPAAVKVLKHIYTCIQDVQRLFRESFESVC